jgi:hypothetical protein
LRDGRRRTDNNNGSGKNQRGIQFAKRYRHGALLVKFDCDGADYKEVI